MQSAQRLAGKVALVTGGGGGIGAATAALFCAQGASVVLVDASQEGLDRTLAMLREQQPDARAIGFQADVSDEARAREAVAEAVRAFGGLDVLVNNAAMRNYSPLAEASREDWEAMVRVNIMGTAGYCKAALPQLRGRRGAAIVNVSSCYAVTGRKGMGLYDTTKAGMLAMTRTLAFEEAPHGVRVNAICPGSTLTDFHVRRAEAAGRSVEKLKTERNSTSLIGRWAEPKEIAHPILWLASDEASFITGTTLMVDGGLHIM
jgi:meso-butanediol dehydrogenase/(S,S)-butanediol dehydrogenase/diacetyl reductase